jgi:16S rRNA (cytidine1402-2'-O)-methyltransferase
VNPDYIIPKPEIPTPLKPGLYLVATPIGNLGDITLRALRVLGQCSLVAAEDTRRVRILLNSFEIKVKTVSYREHNRARATPELLETIRKGGAVALVSDAGTPCISDPGAELVTACAEAGLAVYIVPGPSAAIGALALSGFPGERFSFIGFLPSRSAARRRTLAEIRERPEPLVFFEAPHRVIPTLEDMLEVLGDRHTVFAREMTKVHEERLGGTLSYLLDDLKNRNQVRGEFALVVEGACETYDASLTDEEIRSNYKALLAEGVEPNEALKRLAAASGRAKRELYKFLRGGRREEGE